MLRSSYNNGGGGVINLSIRGRAFFTLVPQGNTVFHEKDQKMEGEPDATTSQSSLSQVAEANSTSPATADSWDE